MKEFVFFRVQSYVVHLWWMLIVVAVVHGPCHAEEYTYTLKHQAFPDSGHPGVLVHLSPNFDPKETPFDVVVFIHGWSNCIQNVILEPEYGISCTPGQPKRHAFNLTKQFDDTGVNALLVIPEVAYDQESCAPGLFGQQNGFRDFLTELFSNALAPVLGPHSLTDLGRIVVYSHSGGYEVASAMFHIGGVNNVLEIGLFDSFYYHAVSDFDTYFLKENLDEGRYTNTSLAPRERTKYYNIYTDAGGTYDHSLKQAQRVQGYLAGAKLPADTMLFDNTYSTLNASQYETHPIIIKRSSLTHNQVPRYYFWELVRHSALKRPSQQRHH